MDYNIEDEEHWAAQEKEYCFRNDSNYDIPECLLKEVTLNEEDLSYMFEETTPLKACGDLAYQVNHNERITHDMNKESEKSRGTSSQVKRRRMLQFGSEQVDSHNLSEDISSEYLKSNETEASLEFLPQASQLIPGLSDGSASGYEGLDQSSELWLSECLNDPEMNFDSNDMNFLGESNYQIDISEFCNNPPEFEANVVEKRVTRTPKNIIFKGTKSFIHTPTKLASSVAYPFAFIKPCGVHGDVTLNDINQRIHTPSKPKKDDPALYPTSAFSGKPVVGKTKIRTGGKGSITIMRTRG